jgi:release factor glutamine methyltransferase
MSVRTAAAALSIRELRHEASAVLEAAGIEQPSREADWLLAPALGVNPYVLVLDGDRTVSDPQAERAWSFVRRRAAREPLPYILGTQEFRGLELVVSQDVLIPRPESEILVEEVVRAAACVKKPVIADVGTGSGCIAVAIARECPEAMVYAVDVSGQALAVAWLNAARHGVRSRVRLIRADLLSAFSAINGGPFDAIVSNPPYIPDGDIGGLQPEVACHEPRLALAGGADGVACHRRLLAGAPALLKPGGFLIVELGFGQAGAVMQLARSVEGLAVAGCRKDAAGIERVFVARRSPRRVA